MTQTEVGRQGDLNEFSLRKNSRAAKEFAEEWKNRGDEKSETHSFWIGLLRQVFGIENAEGIIQFEKRVMLDHKSFIDGYIENTLVLIEQKSIDIDLRKAYKQSDGTELTPYQQAHRYAANLPRSEFPRWIITCNFKSFLVYDMESPKAEPQEILLENLEAEYYRLSFIAEKRNIHLEREEQLSKEAGDLVGRLYDALILQYAEPENPQTLKSLNALCVRLVFCLYSEDAGLFGSKSAFRDYMLEKRSDFRAALIGLFKVLDTPPEERDRYADESLLAFPYVNGGLFADESIEIPCFTDEIIRILLEDCSAKFNWSDISPTIFGAVFESTLNPETRRSGGMHYTSVENIHKVIDSLFMDDLDAEFRSIKSISQKKARNSALLEFQRKISSLKFLDPACGSGNFLTESYVSLRRLENEIIKERYGGEKMLSLADDIVKVSLSQFYGIEINDFAVSVAKAALWIAESQMVIETERIIDHDMDFLPLKNFGNIVEGNALELDWSTLRASAYVGTLFEEECHTDSAPLTRMPLKFDYIMGNPPFVGGMMMTNSQHEQLEKVFPECKKIGEADYVIGWYAKAARLIENENTKCAFVSTNSICQGQSVGEVWKHLIEDLNLRIDFAYRTFRWDSESFEKAHVHCVIVGFSSSKAEKHSSAKIIFDENGEPHEAKNINPYLVDAPNIFIESRSDPLCDVSHMFFGSMPRDGGGFVLSEEEKNSLIKKEPLSEKWIRLYIGAEEFINNKERYCLWLVDANPTELRKCPEVMKRIEFVKNFRLSSKAAATRKFAQTPTLFCQIAQPETDYIIVPGVSSEKRSYIPIGFMSKEIIASNLVQIIPNATLYEFGVLTSSVHMAWMRAVCGRLEMRYRYSKDIVYNNFVWCKPTAAQKQKIEQTAQSILDARAKFPDCSLADLYDENTMPTELRRAHNENDKAVMAAYGFRAKMTEAEIVARLMEMYQRCKRQ